MSEGCRVGVDIGGTFTDIVVVDDEGVLRAAKVPTQEHVFAALVDGLSDLNVALGDILLLVHGTTVGTNALIERTGARTLLITTMGFRDILEIRRTNKGDLFDLNWSPPDPIIPRIDRVEVDERVNWTGAILRPLDTSDLERILRIIDKRQIEAVAIVFLHSYVNPSHEHKLRDLLHEARPRLHISISSDVVPMYREFERSATTAANAYLAPVVARYLEQLAEDLTSGGYGHELWIMQSNGGVTSLGNCKQLPARTVLSGPAGGAVALAEEAERSGVAHMIGLDIGGTTADVSIVWDGEARWRSEISVEFGLPILFPAMDIVSIGAGGGSVAWVDSGGMLRVGPRSAGSHPGPACYGRGGWEPTTTDAQLVLNRLSEENFLGGAMTLYRDLSERAIEGQVAHPLNLDSNEAAAGIIEIATASMIQAVRLVTVERGYDPRDFILCAFGGAGGLYAATIASELRIPTVMIPVHPGVFSAYGVLIADTVHDVSETVLSPVDAVGDADLERRFEVLEHKVLDMFADERINATVVNIERYADLLYAGQTHPIPIPLPKDGRFGEATRGSMLNRFHQEHRRRFGHADVARPVELVNLRVFGKYCRRRDQAGRPHYAAEPPHDTGRRHQERDVYFSEAGGFAKTRIYGREVLGADQKLTGPAIVEQMDTTIVIPPGMSAGVDKRTRNLIIETHGGRARES